jgi:hypothetical protein
MTEQEALVLVDSLLQSTTISQRVSDLQSLVFRGTWAGQSYQAIADQLEYECDYVKQVGSRLWRSLSHATGEEITKHNIREALRRYQAAQAIPSNGGSQDWGEAIDVSDFWGRQADLQTLETWLLGTQCRLIGIFGLGGIGKTSLSVKLAQQVGSKFDYIIWRSLRQAPPLSDLLHEIVPFINRSLRMNCSISVLIEQLRKKRCLLVLDNVESILQGGERSGLYKAGYEDYADLFTRVCDQSHQSCLVLTGREKPGGIAVREGKQLPVRSLQLQGLSVAEAQQILIAKGLEAPVTQYQDLVNYFGGNPLALKLAATAIQNLFGGDIRAFLLYGCTVFNGLQDLLQQQVERLSPLQQQIMFWLAFNQGGGTPAQLQEKFVPSVSTGELLTALEALLERSLIEATEASLTQQPVIMEYIREYLFC